MLNCIIGATGAKPALPVGSTSESCTRGIDVCVTPTRLANGARLVLLDTEGLASMEQDEAYDAQVFALALLLSSYFVLNSMGVLDEAAIDRLYLISELSKHVCVRTDAAKAMQHSGGEAAGGGGGGADDGAALAAAEADLAQFFPPLLWVLRDFVVDLVADGRPISQDEYMEKALEPRPTTARRADERNRVRAAIRTLFPRRACVTLVRPAADESAVRHAVDLAQSELRPEFVSGMRAIQARLLGAAYAHGPAELAGASASGNGLTAGGGSAGGAPVKKLFGAELSGAHLAALAQQYVGALNTAGVVPSIRGAWEYVVADACRQAKETAMRAHSANLARALAGGGAAAGGGPAADAGSAEAQAQAGPVREAEELLLAVAQPSGIAARESYRRAAIAGPDADATLAQLEAEIATADGRAVGALADASNDSCAAAAERLGARLEAALAEAGAEAEAEAVEGAGAGAQPDVRARARDELPRALRLYAQGYAAEASGPAKARVLQEAIKGRVAAAVEGAVRRLDGSAREALAAAAAERAALAVRLAACEASLEARTAALEAATAERAQARADADDLKAQLQAQGALLAEARAARAVAEAEMAASARAAAAELAAAKAEAAGEREGRERAAQLLDDARAQAAAEAQRATEAQRGVEAQLAEAREQLVISRADTERAAERLASAQRESDSALAAARAAADSSTADCELLRGQLAALTAQLQAVRLRAQRGGALRVSARVPTAASFPLARGSRPCRRCLLPPAAAGACCRPLPPADAHAAPLAPAGDPAARSRRGPRGARSAGGCGAPRRRRGARCRLGRAAARRGADACRAARERAQPD